MLLHRMFVVLVAVSLALLSGAGAGAQEAGPEQIPEAAMGLVTTAFTYQGQLTKDGAAVVGPCDFQFALYDTLTGPALVTQEKLAVALNGGAFTVPDLDFGAGKFNGNARWLGVAVRCPAGSGSYTPLGGRQPLTATPYALALPGMRTEVTAGSPNVIGGQSGNSTIPGVMGATIAGGGTSANANSVTDNYGTVSGGEGNRAGGGTSNPEDRGHATVGGGTGNIASGQYSTVGGGNGNIASGFAATVPGGQGNEASGAYSIAAGRDAHAFNAGSFVWADGTGTPLYSTVDNQFLVRAAGGMRILRGTSDQDWANASALYVDQKTDAEAAWLRQSSTNPLYPTLKLLKPSGSTNDFLAGEQGGTRKFHVDKDGAWVAGSDFAEALPAVGGKAHYEPGDVLVMSAQQAGAVEKCRRPYDSTVVGVYSTRPGVVGADKGGVTEVQVDDIPVAVVGIVPVKVSAEAGPIQLGDMLTTSATAGHAMRCAAAAECFGRTIGKAMEALPAGTGVIKVLVTLQ